ncbi:MAG: hypothetical protein LBK98_10695, partial [Peptococcaceae bacterium]|nr:hypothetical protein [Peptococcaceae bacterium]
RQLQARKQLLEELAAAQAAGGSVGLAGGRVGPLGDAWETAGSPAVAGGGEGTETGAGSAGVAE